MCKNKYDIPELTTFPMIVYLYDYSISDTYSFMFAIQSMKTTTSTKAKTKMIVTPITNAKKKIEMKCFCISVGFCLKISQY